MLCSPIAQPKLREGRSRSGPKTKRGRLFNQISVRTRKDPRELLKMSGKGPCRRAAGFVRPEHAIFYCRLFRSRFGKDAREIEAVAACRPSHEPSNISWEAAERRVHNLEPLN